MTLERFNWGFNSDATLMVWQRLLDLAKRVWLKGYKVFLRLGKKYSSSCHTFFVDAVGLWRRPVSKVTAETIVSASHVKYWKSVTMQWLHFFLMDQAVAETNERLPSLAITSSILFELSIVSHKTLFLPISFAQVEILPHQTCFSYLITLGSWAGLLCNHGTPISEFFGGRQPPWPKLLAATLPWGVPSGHWCADRKWHKGSKLHYILQQVTALGSSIIE